MMKIMDKVLDSLGLFEENTEDKKEQARSSEKAQAVKDVEPVRLVQPRTRTKRESRIAAKPEPAKAAPARLERGQVLVADPRAFEDSQGIADHLRNGRAILLNFERTEPEAARRIVDFVSGVAYALGGNIKKVGQGIFLCAPEEMEVTFDVRGDYASTASSWEQDDFDKYLK